MYYHVVGGLPKLAFRWKTGHEDSPYRTQFTMSELFFIFIFSVSFIVLLDRQNKNVSAKFNWEPGVYSRLLVDRKKVHEENIVEMFLVGKKKVNLIYRIIKTRQN